MSPPQLPLRSGRPPVTTAGDLAAVALGLFADRGFDATTVEDIAAAAGIGRRTFFRYFASKNDLVWGDFDAELERLRRELAGSPVDEPVVISLRRGVVEFNRVDEPARVAHRERMTLILTVPALQAHSMLRYTAWRHVIAEFVADRTGAPVTDLLPQLVAWVCLGATVAAYHRWLADGDTPLCDLIDAAMTEVAGGLPGLTAAGTDGDPASPA